VLSRTARAQARVTLFGWPQEERVMTEHTPQHEPTATDQPPPAAPERAQPSKPERRARVKAHVKAVLKRLRARLMQSP
jgi:hypothetical protein